MKSIIQKDYDSCFLCGTHYWLEEHHIFGGNPNRKKSEKYGLKVMLCHFCHNEAPFGVHFNQERMLKLHQIGQRAFEEKYPDKDFLKEVGRNYL